MLSPTLTDPTAALRRFQDLSAQIRKDGYPQGAGAAAGHNLPTAPVEGCASAEIFLASRADQGPEGMDVIHDMSFQPQPAGERIVTETWLRRQERTLMDRLRHRPGTSALYLYATEMQRGSAGAQIVDAVLARYDLASGRRLQLEHQADAVTHVWRLEDETGLHLTP